MSVISRWLATTLVVGVLFSLLGTSLAGAEETGPWKALERLRLSLQAESPISADFVQTFLPAGFSEGEAENGTLGISLPDCLRWDYGEPFPKSFLLCDDTAYYWNPGETLGKRYSAVDEQSPGLDFFLLSTEDLRARYRATGSEVEVGVLIDLEPIHPTDDVVELHVLLDRDHTRILELRYKDSEGNLTVFAMSDYRRGAVPGQFTPPAEIEWEDS